MKIENQVCTLEQAKKLKELGVIQEESQFYYRGQNVWHHNEVTDWPNQEQFYDLFGSGAEAGQIFAAFTVAELGQMLPAGYDTMAGTVTLTKREWLGYDLYGKYIPSEKAYDTEAQCRAAMLIYLIESKLTTPEETNKRLNHEN